MSKRAADRHDEMEHDAKAPDLGTGASRMRTDQVNDSMGDFEDAWEDDYESGDENGNDQDGDGMLRHICVQLYIKTRQY